jgi:uncharacterized protein YjcR
MREIAARLGLSESTVRGWKTKDAWDSPPSESERSAPNPERSEPKPEGETNTGAALARQGNQPPKGNKGNKGNKGGPKGNQYAKGNKGGPGGPLRNKHALKTGEFETIFFTSTWTRRRF